jgi:hypothetical protein
VGGGSPYSLVMPYQLVNYSCLGRNVFDNAGQAIWALRSQFAKQGC